MVITLTILPIILQQCIKLILLKNNNNYYNITTNNTKTTAYTNNLINGYIMYLFEIIIECPLMQVILLLLWVIGKVKKEFKLVDERDKCFLYLLE